jgi:hypothetical protein
VIQGQYIVTTNNECVLFDETRIKEPNMHKHTTPASSKTANILTAIGVTTILFLFGFLPFGWLGFMFLGGHYEEVFIKILFWIIFLAMIAFAATLIRLAMKSWDDKRKVTGIYSVLFGSLAILFVSLIQFYLFRVTVFEEGMMILLVILPALYGFPVIGLILGLIGFKGKWGKTGLLLVAGQFVLWATGYFPF